MLKLHDYRALLGPTAVMRIRESIITVDFLTMGPVQKLCVSASIQQIHMMLLLPTRLCFRLWGHSSEGKMSEICSLMYKCVGLGRVMIVSWNMT